MNNTLLDNSEKFLMRDILRQFIGSGKYNHICIATGYWDLPGMALVYDQLKSFLENGGRLDILIGQEPQLRAYQTHAPEPDAHRFPDFYLQRDINLLTDEYRPTAELIQQYCHVHKYEAMAPVLTKDYVASEDDQEDSQIQIRIFGQEDAVHKQFLHAKCYIFLNKEEGEADGIIGSSNFTQKGLEDNAELNYLETNSQVVASDPNPYIKTKSHKVWFDEKWEQSEPWNGKFLQILSSAPVGQPQPMPEPKEDLTSPLTPYELYIKLLQTKFGDLVDKNLSEIIEGYLPRSFDRYGYQIDAVKQCFSTMQEHGGFMLADVVGLGKTIVGTLVIKHFLQIPDDDGRERKVLIITPPAIRSAWVNTIAQFDQDTDDKIAPCIDYITTGSIGKLVDDLGDDDNDNDESDSGEFEGELQHENYGLIIIDESHKFRNSGTAMYKSLDALISQIGTDTGAYPYIGLLSATPQNNRPDDLKNQIYLFERNHSDTTLTKANSGDLESFFSDINNEYAGIIHPKDFDERTPEERTEALKALSTRIRECVLADIMVRRTRTDVQTYYADDMRRQNLHFPKIKGPVSLNYKMDSQLALLFAETMDCISPSEDYKQSGGRYLNYYRYRAIQYLRDPKVKARYDARGSRNADSLADQLAKIMMINLVKRLESSFSAFYQSLLNLRQYTKNMIDMWRHDNIFICPQIDVNAEFDIKAKSKKRGKNVTYSDCVSDLRAKIDKLNVERRNIEDRNQEFHCEDMNPDYIELLQQDYDILCDLCDRWAKNTEDPKLDVFKDNLKHVLFDIRTNAPQKLVIFSEAIDTVDTIKRVAENQGYRVLKITASNRNELETTIRENFDANYGKKPGEVQKNDYDIIVTTEVLAEGINLHRANCILNYDTPWNSTRLMQRIGRVNRIGSTQEHVYVYNFNPSAEGDAEIQLVQKAYTKLQSFHTLFGEDSKVFTEDEEVAHYDLNTVVNGVESPLEKYIFELKQFKLKHPARYEYIVNKDTELESAVAQIDGNSYFLVRAAKLSGLFVKVNPEATKGKIISAAEMYQSFAVPEAETAIALPDNWNDKKKAAELAVNKHLHKMNVQMGKSAKATKAKEILRKMADNNVLSASSKNLLSEAFQLVNKGNPDVICKVLAFDEWQNSAQLDLFGGPTSEDFDQMIEREISHIVANVRQRYGKAEVYIGLSK